MANFPRSETGGKLKSIFTQPTKVATRTLPYRLAKNEQRHCLTLLRCTTDIICGTRLLRKLLSPSVRIQTLSNLESCQNSSFDLCEFVNDFIVPVCWTSHYRSNWRPTRAGTTNANAAKRPKLIQNPPAISACFFRIHFISLHAAGNPDDLRKGSVLEITELGRNLPSFGYF